MNETTLREALAQASEAEAVELFQATLRKCVRMALFEAMEQEVNELCGPKHHPPADATARVQGVKKAPFISMGKSSRSCERECEMTRER